MSVRVEMIWAVKKDSYNNSGTSNSGTITIRDKVGMTIGS